MVRGVHADPGSLASSVTVAMGQAHPSGPRMRLTSLVVNVKAVQHLYAVADSNHTGLRYLEDWF